MNTEDGHGQGFPATRWSLVDRVVQEPSDGNRAALAQLLLLYLPALRIHLMNTKRIEANRADDIIQNFITTKFLEENLVTRADRNRGKFRTYLLTVLDRYIISEARYEAAQKRGGGKNADIDIDQAELPVGNGTTAVGGFDITWARQVLSEAIRRMESECRRTGHENIWGVFECRLLGPLLNDRPTIEYEELVRRYHFDSPTQAANALVTAKRMFQRHLRSVVGDYTSADEDIDEEIRDLWKILAHCRAES